MDQDQDGTVSQDEMDRAKSIIDMELAEEKSDAHRRMATAALASIIVFTALLFMPFIDVQRITAIQELSSMFYIAMASIVGGYLGVSTWMTKR